MPTLIDLTGKRFDRLMVIARDGTKNGHAAWRCECECGAILTVDGINLRSGNTSSCGCLRSEMVAAKNLRHGDAVRGKKRRLHKTWIDMRQRCNNPKNTSYPTYGGRGIKVCPEWDDYEAFADWADSNGYSSDLSIDRIDNDGPYAPDNCRWVDRQTQADNTSFVRYFDWEGDRRTLRQISEICGVKASTIDARLRRGWTIHKAALP